MPTEPSSSAGPSPLRRRPRLPAPSRAPRVTLYTRPGCHLCEDALVILQRIGRKAPFVLDVVDITSDPRLLEQYGNAIPVVVVDGVDVAVSFIHERELRERLERASGAG